MYEYVSVPMRAASGLYCHAATGPVVTTRYAPPGARADAAGGDDEVDPGFCASAGTHGSAMLVLAPAATVAGHRVFSATVMAGRHRVEASPATARIGVKIYGSAPYASYGTSGGLDF